MDVVIIYDVNKDLDVVKEAMLRKGYFTGWASNGKTFRLPNNCIWKPNVELEAAKADLLFEVSVLNRSRQDNLIKVTKCLVLSATIWAAIEGTE